MSARGKCADCGDAIAVANKAQLKAYRGPFFEHWYEQMRLAFEHRRLDDGSGAD